jgi:hypothetical protein
VRVHGLRYLRNMPLHLRSGPADVLHAGTVSSFFGHPLAWTLALAEGAVEVRLSFADDPTTDGPAVRSEALPHGYALTCLNFDDSPGRGSAEPVLLGEVGSDLLFFHFHVSRHGRSTDRTVHYSFYRAPKDQLGWQAGAAEVP